MSVRSMNRMAFQAISSLARGYPPLAEGMSADSKGSIFFYGAARQTRIARLTMMRIL